MCIYIYNDITFLWVVYSAFRIYICMVLYFYRGSSVSLICTIYIYLLFFKGLTYAHTHIYIYIYIANI